MSATAALANDVGRAFYGGFQHLRPAQRAAVEPVLVGQDVLVLAGTGSGKTEAVLAPLVQRWLPAMRRESGCTLLYITPTRALANDLLRRLEPPMGCLGLKVGIRHGERNDLGRAEKPNLLITTPESFDVLVSGRHESLLTVRAVVLDEIHLTYNTQRGFQVASLLKRLQGLIGRSTQVVGLSATVADPDDIWHFFRPGCDAVTVRDEQSKPLDACIREVVSDQAFADLFKDVVTHRRIKVLVFANSRRECDRLGAVLRQTRSFGDNVFVHHSSLDRDARLAAERKFQEAPKAVCVATSTLELGIDIGDIDLVVLFGHPGGWESFLQRVGRGNRRSAKTNVLCVVPEQHGSRFRNILAFESLLSQIRCGRLERERPLAIYGAAVQQLLSVVAERNGAYVRAQDLADLLSAWPHLDAVVVDTMLEELVDSGHLVPHGFKNRFGGAEQLHRLRDLRLIWGNFPGRSREVHVCSGGRQVGSIPAANLLRLSPGAVFRFAGRHWRVRQVRPEQIDVEPTKSAAAIEVSYGGSGARLDPTVVEEMLRLLEGGTTATALAKDAVGGFLSTATRMAPHVGWDRLPVTRDTAGYHYYFTFGGKLLNEVLARWARLEEYGIGEVALRTRQRLDLSDLPTDPMELAATAAGTLQVPADLTTFQGLLPSGILTRELADIWVKAPVHQRSLQRLRHARQHVAPFDALAPLVDSR